VQRVFNSVTRLVMVVVAVVAEVVGDRELRVVANTESHDMADTLTTWILYKMAITQYSYKLRVYFGQSSITRLHSRYGAHWVY
jgi:hypothetical protein